LTEVRQDVLYISYPQVHLNWYGTIEDMKKTGLVAFLTFLTLVPSFSLAQIIEEAPLTPIQDFLSDKDQSSWGELKTEEIARDYLTSYWLNTALSIVLPAPIV